ncbi:PREDICTED: acyl-CoA dehydrogenase family member 9, mitochondrial-like [Priapulus caudatus]|uniref:Acyl-CoA dehydrogenase family member 9, mitochondrial-like n=1 Tax=Priapulus caudatus TaxID=37621 RepID=A0ABM1F972_PRICU|nr:PREDICTED: acyl-CoA dehydrogenase family member 9, mitochondrial-like [Priapulus caudatus]
MLCRNSTAFTRCLLRSWTENERGFSRCCVRWQNKEVVESSDKGRELQKSLKPKRPKPPFIKNLFLGKFDKELLSYPELKDNAELEELNAMVDPIEKFFQNLDSKSIDVNAVIPPETLKQLGELGLFGQQIPEEYGGLGLERQLKKKETSLWLSGYPVIDDERTRTNTGSDAASIQTRATLSEDGTHYLLTGNKIWISNGGIADVFTVFAKTEITDPLGEKSDKVTAFIVERSFGGVTHGKAEDKLGIRGSNTTELHFDATPVPTCNVLGDVGSGFKLAMNILNSGRFSMGSSGAGVLKNLIAMTAEHAVTRKQFGKSLAEFDLIKQKFAKMSVSCYAMESMAYLTAGMLDSGERPDCSLEAAIVKAVFELTKLLGPVEWAAACGDVFIRAGRWLQATSRSAGLSVRVEAPRRAKERRCRRRAASPGRVRPASEAQRPQPVLQQAEARGADPHGHAHRQSQEEGAKPALAGNAAAGGLTGGKNADQIGADESSPREPAIGGGRCGVRKSARWQAENDVPLLAKIASEREERLPAQALEWSVHRFKFAVEVVLQRHGKSVIDQQMELARLTDIAIDIYAMTAVLSRASRSLCIGLKSLDHELLLARAFCVEAHQRVDNNIKDLMKGNVLTNSMQTYTEIAQNVLRREAYCGLTIRPE